MSAFVGGAAGAAGAAPSPLLGTPAPPARTWLELAQSTTAPNAPHARALIQDHVATYKIYAMLLEAFFEQLGLAPVPTRTRADLIREKLKQ